MLLEDVLIQTKLVYINNHFSKKEKPIKTTLIKTQSSKYEKYSCEPVNIILHWGKKYVNSDCFKHER